MAIFFLLVGIEIKREVLEGELSSLRQAACRHRRPGRSRRPAAVLPPRQLERPGSAGRLGDPGRHRHSFLAGRAGPAGQPRARLPEDLPAGRSRSSTISAPSSSSRSSTPPTCRTCRWPGGDGHRGARRAEPGPRHPIAPYVLVGVFLWVCVLKSGVHATLAGVAIGFAIPLRGAAVEPTRRCARVEQALHPWVVYAILPLFALANAGVLARRPVAGGTVLAPLPLGIALGLFVGKQVGVFGSTWLAVRLGLRHLPPGAAGCSLRRRRADRHRLHHEPVHRHARLRRRRTIRTAVRIGVLTGR